MGLFSEQACGKSLALGNSLDLDGDRFNSGLDPRETLVTHRYSTELGDFSILLTMLYDRIRDHADRVGKPCEAGHRQHHDGGLADTHRVTA